MGLKRDNVVISRKAQESIKEIFEFLKVDSSLSVALKVKRSILTKCRSLKDFSGFSKDQYLEELNGDYRSVTLWDYMIIFRVAEKEVRILNIIHTSRHPKNRGDDL